MKNAVLGIVSSEGFTKHPYLQVFLQSSKKNVNGDIVLLCQNLSKETIKKYNDLGFITYQYDTPGETGFHRWLVYYRFLVDNPQYENIILSDTKDVIFQSDPFVVPHNNQMWLFSEGIEYGVENFAPFDHQRVQNALGLNYSLNGKQVVNASIEYGPSDIIKQFCMIVHMTMLCGKSYINYFSDQGTINFLYHNFLYLNTQYKLQTPNTSNFCAHGVCREIADLPPIDGYNAVLENGRIINKCNGQEYIMMHQWDRRTWYPEVLKLYGITE